jgi:hypothetical protein
MALHQVQHVVYQLCCRLCQPTGHETPKGPVAVPVVELAEAVACGRGGQGEVVGWCIDDVQSSELYGRAVRICRLQRGWAGAGGGWVVVWCGACVEAIVELMVVVVGEMGEARKVGCSIDVWYMWWCRAGDAAVDGCSMLHGTALCHTCRAAHLL